MPGIITSAQNKHIKDIHKLYRKARYRRETGRLIVEGEKEIAMAYAAGWHCLHLFHPASYPIDWSLLGEDWKPVTVTGIEDSLFAQCVYRSTSHLLAVLESRTQTLNQITVQEDSLFLIVDHVEKPGNLGAMIRTCDGLGVEAVIVADKSIDLSNPNLIRSSVGTYFHVPLIQSDSDSLTQWMRHHSVHVYTSYLDGAQSYYEVDYVLPAALVVGSENRGVQAHWRTRSEALVKIPMLGANDSLNVSVAMALLIKEISDRTKDPGLNHKKC